MNKFFLVIFICFSISVYSQTNTWTGATDTDWHKACNWSLGVIPTCSHAVVIPTVGNYPSITGIAHSNTVSITSAAVSALSLTSSGGGVLYISNGGGSCAGTATDNGGCNCLNLLFLGSQNFDPGLPGCDFFGGGACGTQCADPVDCAICRTPVMCISMDCFTLCGTDCGGWNVYQYVP